MPAPTTPTPAFSSSVLYEAYDTVANRFGQISPTSTTAFAASVNQTGEAMFGGRPIIATTKYSVANVALSTYASIAASTSNQYTVSTVKYSAPVILVNVTHYYGVVPSNTTVWNSLNVPSSLLATLGQSDVVSFKVAVVTDSEA